MKTLADLGAKIRLTPEDDIWIMSGNGTIYLDDKSPIIMISEGKLEDGHIFYGMHGRVIDGHSRYQDMICNILLRLDADDWRTQTSTQANFKIGHSPVRRIHKFDFRHPEGTAIDSYPVISRFGKVEVIE